MSLINDALKKAQQKRAEEPPPPAAPPAPPPVLRRPDPPLPTRTVLPSAGSPAQPSSSDKPRISSVRYDPYGTSDSSEEAKPRMPANQKAFWTVLGVIAVIAVSVRIAVTFNRPHTEPSDTGKLPVQAPVPAGENPAQVPVPPPAPPASLQPVAPKIVAAESAPKPVETSKPSETPAATPAVSFPSAGETKPAPVLVSAEAAAPTTSDQHKIEPSPTSKKTDGAISAPPPPTAATVAAAAETKPAANGPTGAEGATPAVAFPSAKPVALTPANKPQPTVLPPIYAPRAPAPVNNSVRVQNFIERLRVSGVRISSHGSKVILNDRMFSPGETVDSVLELKLVKIEDGVLTFADPSGKLYVKLYQ